MKKFVLEFLHRGLVACGVGPLVLAIVYLILQRVSGLEMLTVTEVCTGIISLAVLAFLVGGMNAIYQLERLPLMVAILMHGLVLYCGYLGAYLVNDWLEWGTIPIVVFSAIFVVGYLVIWVIIHSIIKGHTAKLNEGLKRRQKAIEDAKE